ncbi:MAG TPA: TIGR02587 family membrane protein [Thermomicrobiales bacterium]|nr:TIGR02587 family membrane protein [Thermomicrobiales bacterium]
MATAGGQTWGQEARSFARAFAGAYIFAVPLLFTMEMWWIGQYATRWKLLAFLLVALLANFGLTYVAGFKRESSLFATIGQTLDAVAVGIVAATVMLLVLNRIGPNQPIDSTIGMILVQAVPLSIGASVANEVFGGRRDNGRQGHADPPDLPSWQELASDVGATAIGGVFVGFSIAPTEEVPMLAAGLEYPHLLALIGFTLLLSYGIVFASGFDRSRAQGLFQSPITETALAYVASLVVAFIALYLLDQIDIGQPLLSIVEQVLVLGVPTTVGGAAGRLVV